MKTFPTRILYSLFVLVLIYLIAISFDWDAFKDGYHQGRQEARAKDTHNQ